MSEDKFGATAPGPASTRITPAASGETSASETASPGATRIYPAPQAGETKIYAPPKEVRKPLFGWLVAVEGPDPWSVFTIVNEENQFIIGSGLTCEIRLEDAGLAERHASIRLRQGVLTVTDLDTEAGTQVNGERVARVELQDGDLIGLGSSTLKFRKL